MRDKSENASRVVTPPLRLVDFNNNFSFRGGGIRTYHLRKLESFGAREDVNYTLLVPSDHDEVELHGRARLVHMASSAVPGAPSYRIFADPRRMRRELVAARPQVIEVGGPYIDPALVRIAARSLDSVLVGFWHTHYPTAYLEHYGNRVSSLLGQGLRRAGWAFARKTYGTYDATIAAANCVIDDLLNAGIERIVQCPLGVDVELFHPKHRDEELRASVGAEDRPLVFFPHRLLDEKGIREVVKAAPTIAERTGAVFVLAGVGPEQAIVDELCASREDCHHIGYLESPEEMARWYASSDLTFGLSAWETFGLSIIEAMSSGLPIVGANGGAARDWITQSGCGVTIAHGDLPGLIDATIGLLERPDLAELGAKGRTFVEERFSWEQTFERLLRCYRMLSQAARTGTKLGGFPYMLGDY